MEYKKVYSVLVCDSEYSEGVRDAFTFANYEAAKEKLVTLFYDEAIRQRYDALDVRACINGEFVFSEMYEDLEDREPDIAEDHRHAVVGTWSVEIVETNVDETIIALGKLRDYIRSTTNHENYQIISFWRAEVMAEAETWICDSENPEDLKLLLEEYGYSKSLVKDDTRYYLAGTNHDYPQPLGRSELNALAVQACDELQDILLANPSLLEEYATTLPCVDFAGFTLNRPAFLSQTDSYKSVHSEPQPVSDEEPSDEENHKYFEEPWEEDVYSLTDGKDGEVYQYYARRNKETGEYVYQIAKYFNHAKYFTYDEVKERFFEPWEHNGWEAWEKPRQ